jgi:hypothetical protein
VACTVDRCDEPGRCAATPDDLRCPISHRCDLTRASGSTEPGAVLRSAYEIGNRSLFFLSVTMGFIGMILVYQSGLQALRVVPDLTLLGATFLEICSCATSRRASAR